MNRTVTAYLERARQALESARGLTDLGDAAGVVNRAYYDATSVFDTRAADDLITEAAAFVRTVETIIDSGPKVPDQP